MKYINGMVRHNSGRAVVAMDPPPVAGPPFAPDMSWNPLPLLNGWVDYGDSYGVPRFRKLASGQVEVQGIVKNGTAVNIATLPAGYRPGQGLIFAGVQHPNAFARFTVQPDGVIRAESGYWGSTWFTINCTFYAEQ